jgi:hypothetical protein
VATSVQETKDARIEGVVARVRETVDEPQVDDVERFVRAYYAHVAPEDLAERSGRISSGRRSLTRGSRG